MDDVAVCAQDPVPEELPPAQPVPEPTSSCPEATAADDDKEAEGLATDGQRAPGSELTKLSQPNQGTVVGQVVMASLALDAKALDAGGDQDRGWLHRDILSSQAQGESCAIVGLEGENHDRDSGQAHISSDAKPHQNTAVVTPLDSSSVNSRSHNSQELSGGDADVSDVTSPPDEEAVSDLPTKMASSREEAAAQPGSKNSNSTNRTSSIEAIKNRLLGILNAKTKELFMSGQKGSDTVLDLPPNTEIIQPSSVGRPSESDSAEDGSVAKEEGQGPEPAADDSNLIINRPVTQMMAKSKRKTKKPLPNRSSLESMIDAASDPTDFFSIASTLHDSEEDDVLLLSERLDAVASPLAKKADRASPAVEIIEPTDDIPGTKPAVPASKTVTALQDNVLISSQPATTLEESTAPAAIRPTASIQAPTTPTSLPLLQTVTAQPTAQLTQPAHYVQHVLPPQPQQLSLLQQKLVQPMSQGGGGLLQQGQQILLQGNLMQGSVLQTGLTSIAGTQQMASPGSLILQQQQQQPPTAQQQFVPMQHVPVGAPVIQQTAVMPPLYQGQLPILQQQAAQPPVVNAQQTNSTIFTCSSPTPTVIKPQQTVFVLQRGDMLKLDPQGNLIITGRESLDGGPSQTPAIQPGSSVIPVNTIKNLLNTRQPSGAVSQLVSLPGAQPIQTAGVAVAASSANPSRLMTMKVNPSVVTSVGSFNRPVFLGKHPVASVQPQRQKVLCPNPELELIRTTSLGSTEQSTLTVTSKSTLSLQSKALTVKSDLESMSVNASSMAGLPGASRGGIKIFQCEKCKKLFVSKASLFNHLASEMHSDNIPEHVRLPFKCSHCEARFAFKASAAFHRSRPCIPDKPTFNIICSICKLRFKALMDLERHVVRCHHLLPGQNPDFVDRDTDDTVRKKEPSNKVLPNVLRSLSPEPPVTKQKKKDLSAEGAGILDARPPIKLVMSMKRKKKSKRRHKKRRRSSSDLNTRCVSRVVKDKDANTRYLIKTHGKYINRPTRPFCCLICSKGFSSEHCLLEHIKTHIKPFSCSTCGWKSARKDNILKHIQLHHGGPAYCKKRQGKSKKEAVPSPSSTEEEDVEEPENEVKITDNDEDDQSDNEDPDIELDEDDKPNDYFGSGKFDGYDDDSDNDNSRGSNNNTDKKDSDGQSPGSTSEHTEKDNKDETPTPVPQDHNYLTRMQIVSGGADSIPEVSVVEDITKAPSEVTDNGSGASNQAPPVSVEQPNAEKTLNQQLVQGPKMDAQDGDEPMEQQDKPSEATPPQEAMEVDDCDQGRALETVTQTNSNSTPATTPSKEDPSPASSSSPGSPEVESKTIETTSEPVTSTKEGPTVQSEVGSAEELQLSSDKGKPADLTHLSENEGQSQPETCSNPSNILPLDPKDALIKPIDAGADDRSLESPLKSDCESDNDILEWTSLNSDSEEGSTQLEDEDPFDQLRPFLLDENQTSVPIDDSIIIDEDNLEIRPRYSDHRGALHASDKDIEEADETSAYYTVLNAEGSNDEAPEEGKMSVTDGSSEEEAEVPVLSYSENVFPVDLHPSDVDEMSCQEAGEDGRQDDGSQAHAKCDIDPDVRVKTEYQSLCKSGTSSLGEHCSPESPTPQLAQSSQEEVVFQSSEQRSVSETQEPLGLQEEVFQEVSHEPKPVQERPKKQEKSTANIITIKQEPVDIEDSTCNGFVSSAEESTERCAEISGRGVSPTIVNGGETVGTYKDKSQALTGKHGASTDKGEPAVPTGQIMEARKSPRGSSSKARQNEAGGRQALPVISAVGSLSDPSEGVTHPRKSVILEALNRPSPQYPAQPYQPSSSAYEPPHPRLMYNPMGMPLADPSMGQPYLPRYPHPGNPYLAMLHSGTLVDPREQYYPGQAAAMGYNPRSPHAVASLPESRFPPPSRYPLGMSRAEQSYLQQREHQGREKHSKTHSGKHSSRSSQQQSHPSRQWLERQKHHSRSEYGSLPPSHSKSQQAYSSSSSSLSAAEPILFPKYSFEDIGGQSLMQPARRNSSDALTNVDPYYKASKRHHSQEVNGQVISRHHVLSEIAKRQTALEQKGSSHGTSPLPAGSLYPHASHIPARPLAGESLSSRPPALPRGSEVPVPLRTPADTGKTLPNGASLPGHLVHGLPSENDQPPPLVYQGPQKAEDLSLQKLAGKASEPSKDEDSSTAEVIHVIEEETAGIDKSAAVAEYSQVQASPRSVKEASSAMDEVYPFSKPPPPPPPPLPMPSSYGDQSSRPSYGQEELLENRALAHQRRPDYMYIPGRSGSSGPTSPTSHGGLSLSSSDSPSSHSVPRSPKRRHSSAGSSDQTPTKRRRRSTKMDDNPEERPYACHICGSRFKRSNNLTDHVRIHSRPYKCGECSFDTTRWQYLADHLKKNHNFEGDSRELEMMFKSGKRLKPTDHIPETCYQPLPSEKTDSQSTSPHPVRNGFSPGSRSMVVPSSTIILPRGTDIVHREKHRRKKHRSVEDPDEDLVDFFGLSSSQEEGDSTVTPVTVTAVETEDDRDDAASGNANGAQISPGSTQAQMSPLDEAQFTPLKNESDWSKGNQLPPNKVQDELAPPQESNCDLQTSEESALENCELSEAYESMLNGMKDRIRVDKEDDTNGPMEDCETQIKQENAMDTEEAQEMEHEEEEGDLEEGDFEEALEEGEEEEDEEEDGEEEDEASDQEYGSSYHIESTIRNPVEDEDDGVLFTPSGRPKRRTGNYTFRPKSKRNSENNDPEYNPTRRGSWKKKRGIMLKIHLKRGKKRGRPRNRPISESSSSRVEALSTHIGGGLDLTPYYSIVDTSDGDTDKRPYQCKINDCNKRFKSKQHMREHLFTHLKPYKCDGCGVGFARTDYLAMHMRDTHKMSPTRADLYNKRKCANGRAMACRMRPSKDRRRQELQQSFRSGIEL